MHVVPCFRLTTGELSILCSLSYALPLAAWKKNKIWYECRSSGNEAKHVIHVDVDAARAGMCI